MKRQLLHLIGKPFPCSYERTKCNYITSRRKISDSIIVGKENECYAEVEFILIPT